MPRVRPVSNAKARRGVILMVVLALLTLFSVLGLSFVLYANAQARSSEVLLQAEADATGPNGPDVSGDTLANYLFSALIYGADDVTGIYSAARGHDLSTSMYGFNYQVVGGKIVPLDNNVPFNGLGRMHEPVTFLGPKGSTPIDGYTLVNYTCFQDAQGNLIDGFLRDPERLGVRMSTDISTVGKFFGGFNVPWTYPDLNNMYLAAVKADGTVLTPSFHRSWTGFGTLDPGNPNWYDATQPWLKYQVMRPRPVDHLLAGEIWDPAANMPFNVVTRTYRKNFFPPPGDGGGDVKNLMGSPGTLVNAATNSYANNDSVWMDFGFPVMIARDGKKYKPLAAVTMIDLDNRVNVNVHGNMRGSDPGSGRTIHVSNQGWGPWEVNLSAVLNADAGASLPSGQQPEWTNLFSGRSGPSFGRYGPDGQPGVSGSYVQPTLTPRFFSAIDVDGTKGFAYNPSDPFALPGTDPNAPPFFPFPYYPSTSYGNGNASKFKNHPLFDGYFQQAGDDRLFAIANMEALLRYGDVGTESLRSELLQMCPKNFTSASNARRNRNLVTTLSMDLDRPGCSPWARNDGAAPYSIGSQSYPTGNAMPLPQPSLAPGTNTKAPAPVFSSEFGGDGRSLAAALGRIDLNRTLTSYPATDNNGLFTSPPDTAIADRQQLAKDIYDRLRYVTMGESPATPPAPAPTPPTVDPVFEARRWLAQLAVNIVDFIDEDDYMTPFNWYTDPNTGQKLYVFGTELPRVVLNETYAEYVNSKDDADGDDNYAVNFWVELFNPFAVDAARGDAGSARLQAGSTPIYQITFVQNPDNSAGGFGNPGNSTGDVNKAVGAASKMLNTLNNWGSNTHTQTILPCNKQPAGVAGTNQNGFYVVGPKADFQDGNGSFTASFQSDAMNNSLGGKPNIGPPPTPPSTQTYGIYLQRLACAGLPPQNNPNAPNYNPYITVDYMSGVNPNYAFGQINAMPQSIGSTMHQDISTRTSYGRTHPYAGYASPSPVPPGIVSQLQAQKTPQTGQPLNTFFNPNDNAKLPFDWLTHLDRRLVSPAEILHVSGYKPHELTQKFVSAAGTYQEHRLAPIVFDRDLPSTANQSSRLYRAFAFFTVHNRSIDAMCTNARVPGRINLNTIWDVETFRALCDYQQANASAWNVDQIFAALAQSRTPGGSPGPLDVPFKGFGAPFVAPGDTQYPLGSGLDDTLFRRNAARTQALLEVDATHPVRKYELLNKVYNNVTTRSNVFAVWMTIGFFEVLDDTTRPVKLGAEVGLAQHQNIRHRLFAIIDRTNVRQQFQTPVFVRANSSVNSTALAPQTVTVAALSGTYDGKPWSIQPGTQLVVDVGPNQELVTVTQVLGTNQFQAVFTNAHPEGFLMNLNSLPGNPGPQPSYDPRQDSDVVRYLSIIN